MHDRILLLTRKSTRAIGFALLVMWSLPAVAGVYGNVRGIVHDPTHHPVGGAEVILQASDSAFKMESKTNADGEFTFSAVPFGKYSVTVQAPGFAEQSQIFTVVSGQAPVLHYQLALASNEGASNGDGLTGGFEPRLATPRPGDYAEADLRVRRREFQHQLQG